MIQKRGKEKGGKVDESTDSSFLSRVTTSSKLRNTRKRFLIVSVAVLAVFGTTLGVSFTADTGVTTITAAGIGGALPLIWSANYGSAGNLPAAISGVGVAGWKYGTGGASSTPATPGWPTVVAGQAGSITANGDIATIDATDLTSGFLLVTIYITNMKALALTYNSYSLPIRIYSGTRTGINVAWSGTALVDSNSINTANTYLTNNQGYETFKLATGGFQYYAITLDIGGSYYPYQTGASGAATTPAFYITAQRTS
jgi:hypothetical protein